MSSEKVAELVASAKSLLSASAKNPGAPGDSYWRAYVALEYAILDLKLRASLEQPGNATPAKRQRAKKQTVGELAEAAKQKVDAIDLAASPPELLHQLRQGRDAAKALVAGYDKLRRSTTS